MTGASIGQRGTGGTTIGRIVRDGVPARGSSRRGACGGMRGLCRARTCTGRSRRRRGGIIRRAVEQADMQEGQ